VTDGPILLAHRAGEGGPTYLTRRGDNYLMLAFALGVDLERFRADNALWRVQVPFEGMRLVVAERQDPKDGPASQGTAPAPAPATGAAAAPRQTPEASHPVALAAPAPLVHKVKRGETLQGIATRYAVTTDSIRTANQLSRQARLVAGQILKIPLETTR
jgi:LysM repeat protein